ncbi:hypothetical protein [Actinoplanes xinjiangensis]|uniref:hypothetical protein n=1 Tax=Actinoplanes xinjiangensis TaxID=512350 RepID=UPI0011B68330|nr:hypothetical protein [Actinoplanes xinjiangensis]GIF40414.1 hypothetical protein Axi01nite_47250 [Actinoplanes xinjiangensis]
MAFRLFVTIRDRLAAASPPSKSIDAITYSRPECNTYLILSPWMRKFSLGLRIERTVMLNDHAPDLAIAADAAHAWLSGVRPPVVAAVPRNRRLGNSV